MAQLARNHLMMLFVLVPSRKPTEFRAGAELPKPSPSKSGPKSANADLASQLNPSPAETLAHSLARAHVVVGQTLRLERQPK